MLRRRRTRFKHKDIERQNFLIYLGLLILKYLILLIVQDLYSFAKEKRTNLDFCF